MSFRLAVLIALIWFIMLGATLALSTLAATHDTLPGDKGITAWAQDLAFPGEALSDLVRAVTSTQPVLAAGGALAVVLWLRGFRREAAVLALALVILPLLQSGVKEIVDRPRPAPGLVEIRGSTGSPSFPAGHVMSPTLLYGLLACLAVSLPLPTPARAVLLAACAAVLALTAPVNVWLGVHWPSDVLGGYAWGLLLLLPAALASTYRRQAP